MYTYLIFPLLEQHHNIPGFQVYLFYIPSIAASSQYSWLLGILIILILIYFWLPDILFLYTYYWSNITIFLASRYTYFIFLASRYT